MDSVESSRRSEELINEEVINKYFHQLETSIKDKPATNNI